MIILIDTSTNQCRLTIVDDNKQHHFSQDLGRGLARFLLKFIEDSLVSLESDVRCISGIGVMKGPGSFTGLRIGLTVANTLADSLDIPIIGEMGDNWREQALARLDSGENDQIVLPFYGGEANITRPRK